MCNLWVIVFISWWELPKAINYYTKQNTNILSYLIGDVPLNEHCTYNHQCSASTYAACLEGTCKCIDGYKAQNDGQCEKGNDDPNIFDTCKTLIQEIWGVTYLKLSANVELRKRC